MTSSLILGHACHTLQQIVTITQDEYRWLASSQPGRLTQDKLQIKLSRRCFQVESSRDSLLGLVSHFLPPKIKKLAQGQEELRV